MSTHLVVFAKAPQAPPTPGRALGGARAGQGAAAPRAPDTSAGRRAEQGQGLPAGRGLVGGGATQGSGHRVHHHLVDLESGGQVTHLLGRRLHCVKCEPDLEFHLLAQVAGARLLLAELGGSLGAAGIAASAVEHRDSDLNPRSPGGPPVVGRGAECAANSPERCTLE